MPANTRFAVAVHTAGMLAAAECCALTSEAISKSVNTNPVVVRRIIGRLAKAGLVNVRKGQGGGAILSRPPNRITLGDIYRAVEPGPLFQIPDAGRRQQCPIARFVGPVLSRVFGCAEQRVAEDLDRTTLAQVVASVRRQATEQKGHA